MAGLNVAALTAVGAGGVLVYAGWKGVSVPGALRAIIGGHTPASAPASAPITAAAYATVPGAIAGAAGSPAAAAIAADALRYQGAGYVYGGAPARGIGIWDCSSFANWVIGRDLGGAIPGYAAGTYTGAAHGPATGDWLLWSGAQHIPRAQLAAGDIACWQSHMGIAISNTQMISARNSRDGTGVSGIDGFISGEVLFCLRLR
jgi:cell wall-associated NlpC family hydrolase